MIKKSIIYVCLLVFISSCEKNKFHYTAECSYYVNGELITNRGGSIACFIDFTSSDTLVTYNTATSMYHQNVNSVIEDKNNYISFFLWDWSGTASRRYFNVQNLTDDDYFELIYRGKKYQAISGYIGFAMSGNFINSLSPYKEEITFKGTFEAVMVHQQDTVYVTNGSCYYSWMEYNELR
jgi:hypothetical protein